MRCSGFKIRDLLLHGTAYDHDSQLLLMHVAGLTKVQLLCCLDETIPDEKAAQYRQLLEQVTHGYPVKYILGSSEFMSLDFIVNEHVLIPRPETELLVEQAISVLGTKKTEAMDMCTGSGCIGISLAKYTGASVWAVDQSAAALAVAKENARRHGVSDKIMFLESDLFTNVPSSKKGSFDLLIANPPYIETGELQGLYHEQKLLYEPREALDGGENGGLTFYQKIIQTGLCFLKNGGILLLEIGYDQADAVCELLHAKNMQSITVTKDLAGNDRVIQSIYERKSLC